MEPVKRNDPIPRFLLLKRGYPDLPLNVPDFLSCTRRKKFFMAVSRSRSDSCGAALLTSYIQGNAVCLSSLVPCAIPLQRWIGQFVDRPLVCGAEPSSRLT